MNAQSTAATGPSTSPSGRIAVVTGAIGGSGLGIADALAAAGAQVVINGVGQSITGIALPVDGGWAAQ